MIKDKNKRILHEFMEPMKHFALLMQREAFSLVLEKIQEE